MRASLRKTSAAAERSFWVTALILRWMAASTSELISSSLVFSCSSSSIKWRTFYSSAEPARDVIFSLLLRRVTEDHGSVVELDQAAQKKEACVLSHARGLLHVVGHDHNGATVLELEDQVLDLGGGDGIEPRPGPLPTPPPRYAP